MGAGRFKCQAAVGLGILGLVLYGGLLHTAPDVPALPCDKADENGG